MSKESRVVTLSTNTAKLRECQQYRRGAVVGVGAIGYRRGYWGTGWAGGLKTEVSSSARAGTVRLLKISLVDS